MRNTGRSSDTRFRELSRAHVLSIVKRNWASNPKFARSKATINHAFELTSLFPTIAMLKLASSGLYLAILKSRSGNIIGHC